MENPAYINSSMVTEGNMKVTWYNDKLSIEIGSAYLSLPKEYLLNNAEQTLKLSKLLRECVELVKKK